MDLRVKKTKKAIRRAFFELIRQKPVEKITVRELSELAEINKTTFYAHYDTIYDLVDQLEQEMIETIVERMGAAQELVTDPAAFVHALAENIFTYGEDFEQMFSFAMPQFAGHLKEAILRKVEADGYAPKQYENIGALLIFIVNGLMGLRNASPELAEEQMETIVKFVAGGVRGMR